MKKKLIFWIVLSFLVSIYGCTDTFGTDPNVKITELNPTTPEPVDSTNKHIEMNVRWNFVEYFSVGARGSSMAWGNNHKLLRNRFIIDTTKEESLVRMDIEAVCTIPDEAITNRGDRILSMRLIIDSLSLPNGKIENSVDPKRNNLVRLELVVKDFRNTRKYIVNEKELGLIFSIYQESKESGVRGFLNLDLGQFVFLNTFNFQAIFEAEYK